MIGLILLLFAITAQAEDQPPCTNGDAQVAEVEGSFQLKFCLTQGVPTPEFGYLQGIHLFEFLNAMKDNPEFVRRAEAILKMPMKDQLNSTRNEYGKVIPYSKEKEGMEYLAQAYRKWTGSDKKIARIQSDSVATASTPEQLKELTDTNTDLLKALKSGSCESQKARANVFSFTFDDGEVFNVLPISLKPIPGKPHRYEFRFLKAHQNQAFYHGAEVNKREIKMEPDKDIIWYSQDQEFTIKREGGVQQFGSMPTAKARTDDNCELQRVVSQIRTIDLEGEVEPASGISK